VVLPWIESSGLIVGVKLSAYTKRFSSSERAAFAIRVGTTVGHLNNVAYEQRIASAALARQIAIATDSEVHVWDLRPDDWHLIWPELIGVDGAPAVPADQPHEARNAA
jgi:DNA-binding transcriptional regulator YdaS (Cro superfamily)